MITIDNHLNIYDTDHILYGTADYPYLNITPSCTNKCITCPASYGNNPHLYERTRFSLKSPGPSLSQIVNTIHQLDQKNIKGIWICGLGEPTIRLDKIIIPLLKQFNKSLDFYLITNGHGNLINRNKHVAKELKDAGLYGIEISLNAETPEKYEHFCKPVFNKPIKEIYDSTIQFIKECKEVNLNTWVSMIINTPTELIGNPKMIPNEKEFEKLVTNLNVKYKQRIYG